MLHEFRIPRWAVAAAAITNGGLIGGLVYVFLDAPTWRVGMGVLLPLLLGGLGEFLLLRLLVCPDFYDVRIDDRGIQAGPESLGRRIPWSEVRNVRVRWTGGLTVAGHGASLPVLYEVTEFASLVDNLVARCPDQFAASTTFTERRLPGDWGQTIVLVIAYAASALYFLTTGHPLGPVIGALALVATAKVLRDECLLPREILVRDDVLSVRYSDSTREWSLRDLTKLAVLQPRMGFVGIYFEAQGSSWTVFPLHRTRWLELYAALRNTSPAPFEASGAG